MDPAMLISLYEELARKQAKCRAALVSPEALRHFIELVEAVLEELRVVSPDKAGALAGRLTGGRTRGGGATNYYGPVTEITYRAGQWSIERLDAEVGYSSNPELAEDAGAELFLAPTPCEYLGGAIEVLRDLCEWRRLRTNRDLVRVAGEYIPYGAFVFWVPYERLDRADLLT